MRDVRASPPPVPEDARRRAANRAHAEVQKKKKDARAAKHDKKILEHEALEKRRWRQKQDGLPVELSPSPSPSENSSDEDGGIEGGRGPLDHLPDVGETVPGVSVSSPALPGGGGGGAPQSAIAYPASEADTPELWALGKRAIGPLGSTVVVEQAAVEATQLPPQRVEGVSESNEGRLAPVDTRAVSLPPPPLQRRVTVLKRL